MKNSDAWIQECLVDILHYARENEMKRTSGAIASALNVLNEELLEGTGQLNAVQTGSDCISLETKNVSIKTFLTSKGRVVSISS